MFKYKFIIVRRSYNRAMYGKSVFCISAYSDDEVWTEFYGPI